MFGRKKPLTLHIVGVKGTTTARLWDGDVRVMSSANGIPFLSFVYRDGELTVQQLGASLAWTPGQLREWAAYIEANTPDYVLAATEKLRAGDVIEAAATE